MDINYLIFLQELRNSMGSFIPDFFLKLSSFAVGIWPVVFVSMVYWVFDRKEGRKLLGALSLSIMVNGLLKATFCVYRPWIRDARIEPYGHAMVEATGYSFPSGHSTKITSTVGGIGLWLRNKQKALSILCFVIVFLVLFSRNFLGCHTPQDVVIGFACGFLCIWFSEKIEVWSDGAQNRDKTIAFIVLLICVAALIYYLTKPYPIDYYEDGTIICDPTKLIADCFGGLGAMLAFYFSKIYERNGFDFDKVMNWKDRFIVGVIAIIPLYFWRTCICEYLKSWSIYLEKFLVFGVEIVFIMIIVPWIMKKVHESKILDK